MEDLISIIIPVYNGEKFLDKCLTSIINQEYKNLEIILVNDGSTDSSLAICQAFADKDDRIKIFSKPNGGQASARNFALDRIKGSYVSFIDNDDWVRPECYSTLHEIAAESEADITGGAEFYVEDTDFEEYSYKIYSMKEYAEIIIPDLVLNHVIGKLFKAQLFNEAPLVRFPENLRSVEDMGIFPMILKRSERIAMTDTALYFYRVHADNTTAVTARTIVNPLERALIFIERYPMAQDWVPDTMPVILKKAVWFGVSTYTWHNKENALKYSEEYKTIRDFFIKYKNDILNSPLIDKLRKFTARLIISNCTLPFRILSECRPMMKKIINNFYDRRN